MNRRVTLCAACVIAVAAAIAVPLLADAAPFYRHHRFAQELTPEQQAAISAIRQECFNKTQALRDQLEAKHMALRALSPNPNATPEQLSALVDEITALRGQLRAEHQAMAGRMRQEAGIAFPDGFGMGMGRGPAQGLDCPMGWGGGPGNGRYQGHHGFFGDPREGRRGGGMGHGRW